MKDEDPLLLLTHNYIPKNIKFRVNNLQLQYLRKLIKIIIITITTI